MSKRGTEVRKVKFEQQNDQPVVGILTHPLLAKTENKNLAKFGNSRIKSNYVKWVEMCSARAMPFLYDWDEKKIREMFKKINGIMFTGGNMTWIYTEQDCPHMQKYFETQKLIFDLAVEAFENGDYFPIWGVCLGIDSLAVLGSGMNRKILGKGFSCRNYSTKLNIVEPKSRFFSLADERILKIFSEQDVTFHYHNEGILLEQWEKISELQENFRIVATCKDKNGREFASVIEGKDYPSEKVFFDWKPDYDFINRSLDSRVANGMCSLFFGNEVRKSNHKFLSKMEKAEYLIDNFQPQIKEVENTLSFEPSSGIQIYYFPGCEKLEKGKTEEKREEFSPPNSRLYTPGPVQVTETVRMAASRKTEPEFVDYIKRTRAGLIKVAELSDKYTVIPLQGSGTYGVESTIQSFVPKDARMLVIVNGTFGEKMAKITKLYVDNVRVLTLPSNVPADEKEIVKVVEEFKPTHVGMIHCETSTGIINDACGIGKRHFKDEKTVFIVDGMSAFAGITFNIEEAGIDFYVTSPNKCLESIAGVAIIFAKKASLVDHSRSLVLNLYDQYKFFEKYNMFRFTPPMEVVVALDQAVQELAKETVKQRVARYKENMKYLREEMAKIGFIPYSDKNNGHIVSTFEFPKKNFEFLEFYNALIKAGVRIYYFPGKRLDRDIIRIGTIGCNNKGHFKKVIDEVRKLAVEKGYFD